MGARYEFWFEEVQRADDEVTSTTYYGGAVKVRVNDGPMVRLLVSGNDRGSSVWEAVQSQFEELVLKRKLTSAEFAKLEELGITTEQDNAAEL